MFSQGLWIIASLSFLVLGLLHYRGTFFTKALHPKSTRMKETMHSETLNFYDKLPIWKFWIGFNATFANGMLFLGLITFYLGLKHYPVLRADHFLHFLAIAASGLYAWIAMRHFPPIVKVCCVVPLIGYGLSYLLLFIG